MSQRKIYKVRHYDDWAKKLTDWLSAYLQENLIKTFSALSTLIGLCIIFAFHFHIEYSPPFDLQSLASVIFSSAYIGVVLSLMFVFILNGSLLYIWILCKEKRASYSDGELSWFIVRKLVFLAFISAVWFGSALVVVNFKLDSVLTVASVMVLILLFVFFNTADWCWIQFRSFGAWFKNSFFSVAEKTTDEKNDTNADKNKAKGKINELKEGRSMNFFNAFTLIIFQFFPCLLFFLILHDSSANVNGSLTDTTLLSTAIVSFAIVFVSDGYFLFAWLGVYLSKIHRLFSCLLLFIASILFTFFSNAAFFPMRVANATKIGNFYADKITINKHGCEVLSSEGLALCNTRIGDSYKICDTYVISRIGTETFLKLRNL